MPPYLPPPSAAKPVSPLRSARRRRRLVQLPHGLEPQPEQSHGRRSAAHREELRSVAALSLPQRVAPRPRHAISFPPCAPPLPFRAETAFDQSSVAAHWRHSQLWDLRRGCCRPLRCLPRYQGFESLGVPNLRLRACRSLERQAHVKAAVPRRHDPAAPSMLLLLHLPHPLHVSVHLGARMLFVLKPAAAFPTAQAVPSLFGPERREGHLPSLRPAVVLAQLRPVLRSPNGATPLPMLRAATHRLRVCPPPLHDSSLRCNPLALVPVAPLFRSPWPPQSMQGRRRLPCSSAVWARHRPPPLVVMPAPVLPQNGRNLRCRPSQCPQAH